LGFVAENMEKELWEEVLYNYGVEIDRVCVDGAIQFFMV
jgi:hypothetical protein